MSNKPARTLRRCVLACLLGLLGTTVATAGEPQLSAFTSKITGQEQYAYVWTVGTDGVGDGMDKLVTVDVHPGSPLYGKVVHIVSVGGRHGAFGAGLTDDRRFLWAAGLASSSMFIFDVASDPGRPQLRRIVGDFVKATGGAAGPQKMIALPGRMMIAARYNDKDESGPTALVEYTNAGEYVATHWMPTDANLRGASKSGQSAQGHGFDIGVLPQSAAIVTSSVRGGDYRALLAQEADDDLVERAAGNTVVIWDLHSRKPKKVIDVPGAPLAVRCVSNSSHEHCFTVAALTAKLWLIHQDEDGDWQAKIVGDVGGEGALPMGLSLSADGSRLWVSSTGDRKARLFDVSNPTEPQQLFESDLAAPQVGQSFDGARVYFASTAFEGYRWDGDLLEKAFSIDFSKESLGQPSQTHFGSALIYGHSQAALAPRSPTQQ